MSLSLWQQCLSRLQDQLSTTEFSMWIRPLQAEMNNNTLALYAPNRFVLDWVRDKYSNNINKLLNDFCGPRAPLLLFVIGSKRNNNISSFQINSDKTISQISTYYSSVNSKNQQNISLQTKLLFHSNINPKHTFNNFIKGKSNQLALVAAQQVAKNPGDTYNPLFLYGNTGLGKTHLLHAIGNRIITHKINAKVVYMHSEKFVQDMIKALKNNTIEDFKHYYRSVDALLIDDIQFFAKKERSQEELFHTFNVLLEGKQQIILTSDRYPKEIIGVEDRLKSRFEWGLTVAIEAPELETRIDILIKKANENYINLSKEVVFFIAKNLHSNVRELEGALNLIIANVNLTGCAITVSFVQETLRDLLEVQKKIITIDKIQKIVAKYFKIKIMELLTKRRSRSVSRPRQIAMALSKKFTNHSLIEIGDAFGKRDHTTVLYACRIIEQLCKKDNKIKEDFHNLIKILSF